MGLVFWCSGIVGVWVGGLYSGLFFIGFWTGVWVNGLGEGSVQFLVLLTMAIKDSVGMRL